MPNNYCSRPFNEMHIEENGNVTPCCVMPSNRFFMGKGVKDYWYGASLGNLRNKFAYDKRPSQCQYCWDAEESSLKTHRIQEDQKGLRQIHVRLNNVCNFKCRMCNPKFSSTWEIENRKHEFFDHDYSTEKDVFDIDPDLLPFIVQAIKKGGLRFINISGGEPLITDANYRLLTYLIDNDATNVTLAYSTNLSKLDYKGIDLMSIWDKFDNVLLEASCDGWGSAVEYSRTGFDRKTFFKNLIKAHRFVNRINCVVNIYSVWTLPYVDVMCEKLNLKPVYAPCFLPEWLNPQHLNRHDKDELQRLYQPYPRLKEVFDNYINRDKAGQGKMMCEYNLMLDKYRGTDFFHTFPQYRKYYDTSS